MFDCSIVLHHPDQHSLASPPSEGNLQQTIRTSKIVTHILVFLRVQSSMFNGSSLLFFAVLFQFITDGTIRNAQQLRGFLLITLRLLQSFSDELHFGFLNRHKR